MKFDLKKPCNNCPFANTTNRVRLTEARAIEIAHSLRDDDRTFPCHKTVDHEERDESTEQHCAGALAMDKRAGGRNWRMRFARMLRFYDAADIDESTTFEDYDAFVRANR